MSYLKNQIGVDNPARSGLNSNMQQAPIRSVITSSSVLGSMYREGRITLEQGENISERIMAIINFTTSPTHVAADITGPMQLNVPLTQLNTDKLTEVWLSNAPVEQGTRAQFTYSINKDILFASITCEQNMGPQESTEHVYREIFKFITSMGYPSLLRTWNYITDINGDYGDMERYKLFCLGRQNAYDELAEIKTHDASNFPAATVIGIPSNLTGQQGIVYFIAGKQPGIPIENPRQTSAYKYPSQYGPVSPAFSRSMVANWGEQSISFISGTASIVGHESRHKNQCIKQLNEIISNLGSLMSSLSAHDQHKSLSDIDQLKVYLRHAADYDSVKNRLGEILPGHPAIFLQGDICRSDLMIEIEGICHANNLQP